MKAEIVTIGTELLLGQIVDTNAVHFYARALADQGGRDRPSADDYSRALNIVGFGISTQKRAYQHTFRKRAMSLLESVELAWCSLGMFYPVTLAEAAGPDLAQNRLHCPGKLT